MRRLSNIAALTFLSVVGAFVVHGCTSGPAATAASTGEAEEPQIEASALPVRPSAIFQDRAGKVETRLKGIEAKLDKIIAEKKTTNKDAEELDRSMLDYAQSVKDAFDTAKNDAVEACKTKGAAGNVHSLQVFEDMAKQHLLRTRKVKARAEEIGDKIRKGEIKAELLVVPMPTGMLTPEHVGESSAGDAVGCDGSLSSAGDDPAREQAQPLVAVGCVALCSAFNWAGCFACLSIAGPPATAAWNKFLSCWNSCSCGWHHLSCCFSHFWCMTTFIGEIG